MMVLISQLRFIFEVIGRQKVTARKVRSTSHEASDRLSVDTARPLFVQKAHSRIIKPSSLAGMHGATGTFQKRRMRVVCGEQDVEEVWGNGSVLRAESGFSAVADKRRAASVGMARLPPQPALCKSSIRDKGGGRRAFRDD